MSAWLKSMIGGVNYALGRTKVSRNLLVREDDTFLVSYPRSGNTWTRFLVANLLEPGASISFANIRARVPLIYNHTRKELERLPRPRFLATHEYFDPQYKRIVYIVRDPRDVVVSLYHLNLRERLIKDGYPWDQYVERFLAGDVPHWGPWTWADNVLSWVATRLKGTGFLLLRYEDMLERTENEAARLAQFLGLERTREQVAKAVALSTAKRMRAFEQEVADRWVDASDARKDIPFVRTAVSGSWRSFLSDHQVADLECAWGQVMKLLGYELTTEEGRKATRSKEGPEIAASYSLANAGAEMSGGTAR
jgi:hypothetical protein